MRVTRGWMGLALAAAALMTACSNELGGDLSVNGAPFEPTSCRNGFVRGYRGVDLTGKSGARLAIASTQTGQPRVVYFAPAAATGTDLGACGTFEIEDQSSTINDVRNVEGKAALDCTTDGVAVKGSVSFSNCH